MKHITEFQHEKQLVPLTIPNETDYLQNTFTVIVGKNGVGKSRLLANMINKFVISERLPPNYELIENFNEHDISRVIAVSTSPFDKFMLPPKNRNKEFTVRTNYRYVGMRSGGLNSPSAISLISSATKGILDRFLKNENYDRLRDVFNTLGFLPEIQLIFKPNFSRNRYNINTSQLSFDQNYSEIDWLKDIDIKVSHRSIENLIEITSINRERIRKSLDKLSELFYSEKAISINIDFTHGEIFCVNKEIYRNIDILDSINTLLNFDLIRLMDMKLHKDDYGIMSLRRASSGEQCMLVIMLGIAGNISDNSLIFIDEPEISLHPKWQEEFMSLLVRTFNKYRSCQFFIATHSPQIVSKLKDENCFVTSLSENKIYPSAFFYDRSSDFQLAELFDAPGSRNEYIARLAFSLLSKVKTNRSSQQEDLWDLQKLLELSKSIDPDDPTLDLIKSIKEVVQYYASN